MRDEADFERSQLAYQGDGRQWRRVMLRFRDKVM
jgi:hypothetical protein